MIIKQIIMDLDLVVLLNSKNEVIAYDKDGSQTHLFSDIKKMFYHYDNTFSQLYAINLSGEIQFDDNMFEDDMAIVKKYGPEIILGSIGGHSLVIQNGEIVSCEKALRVLIRDIPKIRVFKQCGSYGVISCYDGKIYVLKWDREIEDYELILFNNIIGDVKSISYWGYIIYVLMEDGNMFKISSKHEDGKWKYSSSKYKKYGSVKKAISIDSDKKWILLTEEGQLNFAGFQKDTKEHLKKLSDVIDIRMLGREHKGAAAILIERKNNVKELHFTHIKMSSSVFKETNEFIKGLKRVISVGILMNGKNSSLCIAGVTKNEKLVFYSSDNTKYSFPEDLYYEAKSGSTESGYVANDVNYQEEKVIIEAHKNNSVSPSSKKVNTVMKKKSLGNRNGVVDDFSVDKSLEEFTTEFLEVEILGAVNITCKSVSRQLEEVLKEKNIFDDLNEIFSNFSKINNITVLLRYGDVEDVLWNTYVYSNKGESKKVLTDTIDLTLGLIEEHVEEGNDFSNLPEWMLQPDELIFIKTRFENSSASLEDFVSYELYGVLDELNEEKLKKIKSKLSEYHNQ